MINIRYKDLELAESCTFAIPDGEGTEIDLTDDDGTVTIALSFIDNPEKEESATKSSMDFKLINEKKVLVTLKNWNSPLGNYFTKPISFGNFRNREMLIMLASRGTSSVGVREITFNVYLGQEAKNG